MRDLKSIEKKLHIYFQLYNHNKPVAKNEDLLLLGFVNKQFVYDLVDFFNQEFGISISPMEIDFNNIKDIDSIMLFLSKHLNGTK